MLRYKVISKLSLKEVEATEVQKTMGAGGSNPNFILLPHGALRLRTHDATGYHNYELDASYEAVVI